MIRKVIALLVVGLLMMPIFAEMADAGSYYYTGKAYVNKKYRYVGFTPEKITIKTNIRWSKSVFAGDWNRLGVIMYRTLNIKLYHWDYLKNSWGEKDEKTYYNTFNSLGGVIKQEFKVYTRCYYKHWWDRFLGKCYLMFEIIISKDRDLYHHSTGKTKIVVTLRGDGAVYEYSSGTFERVYLTVKGTGTYYVKGTPWDKYKKYWGYSASAQEYNELMAQQTQGTLVTEPVEFDALDVALLSMFILGVAILSYVYISDRKRRKT